MRQVPIPPVPQSKACVCGHSLAGTVVQTPPGAWMLVSCECCLSGRGLCVGLITRPKEFYRLWCVWVWSRSPVMGGHGPESVRSATERAWGRWDSWEILHDLGEMKKRTKPPFDKPSRRWQVNVNLTKEKVSWGSRGKATPMVKLGTRRRWMVLSCPGHFSPTKKSPVPTGGLVGPTACVDDLEERKMSSTCGESNPGPTRLQPSITTFLPILRSSEKHT